MNIWVEKSFEVAKGKGYLDKISEIYPVNYDDKKGKINEEVIKEIKKLLDTHQPKELINYLIGMDRFPFDDPYVGFLRHHKDALSDNPKTLERLWKRLECLGTKGIVEGINKPKSASRRFGHHFSKWLHSQYETLSQEEFLKSKNRIVVLKGGDQKLKKFAKDFLGYERKKGLDFVIKTGNIFVIGESKFVGHSGGTQDKSVREVVSLVKESKIKNVTKVGLVDGVPWVASSTLYKSLHELKSEENIMSVLYLNEFLNLQKK